MFSRESYCGTGHPEVPITGHDRSSTVAEHGTVPDTIQPHRINRGHRDARLVGQAARSRQYDPQALKKVRHYLACFGTEPI
ncbi:hypothetical protein ACWDYH_39415 [Nocardia goodfellowii]